MIKDLDTFSDNKILFLNTLLDCYSKINPGTIIVDKFIFVTLDLKLQQKYKGNYYYCRVYINGDLITMEKCIPYNPTDVTFIITHLNNNGFNTTDIRKLTRQSNGIITKIINGDK